MMKFAAAATAMGIVAAVQTMQPGQMTEARVHILNRGRAEAIPVDLRDASPDAPLRVRVVGPDNTDSSTAPVRVRSTRLEWEYETVTLAADQDVAAALNRQGAAGWETTGIVLATPAGTLVVLKRPR